MNIQDFGERLGIKRTDTDAIVAEIKRNNTMLESCTGPHDFSIALDRRTLKPAVPDNRRDPFCKWQCSKCCGIVDGVAKSWYNKGVRHATK